MAAHEFTIHPEGMKQLQKKTIIRLTILFAFIMGLILFLNAPSETEEQQVNTLPYLAVLFLGITGFSIYNGLQRQKRMLSSYKLTITDDAITREMANVPTITIPKAEVTDIIKNDSAYTIIGTSKINAIGIPAQVNDAATLEELLMHVRPLTVKSSRQWLNKYAWYVMLPAMGVMFLAFRSTNETISLLGGAAIVVVLTYSLIVIQRSKNVDTRTKRMSWFVLIPLLSILAGLILRLAQG